jgi:hypothetical protein
MPSTLNGTGVTFNDATTLQSGNIPAANLGSGTANNTTFLRGDKTWNVIDAATPGQLQLLQEDTFTTSGTWTKATGFGPDDTIMFILLGGGGGGGAAFMGTNQGAANGGTAGGELVMVARYADVTSSIVYTIGAGGVGATRTTAGAGNGTAGGNSFLIVGSNISYLRANGGFQGNAATASGVLSLDSFATNTGGVRVGLLVDPGGLPQEIIGFLTGSHRASGVSSSTDSAAQRIGGGFINAAVSFVAQHGGGAARNGATNLTDYNAPPKAFFLTGGAGSGTANGANATGRGGGGGGCVRQNATAVGGNGSNGALVVSYYRGRVSPLQVLQVGG